MVDSNNYRALFEKKEKALPLAYLKEFYIRSS